MSGGLPQGLYGYGTAHHRLIRKRASDMRNLTEYQDFVGLAPLCRPDSLCSLSAGIRSKNAWKRLLLSGARLAQAIDANQATAPAIT